MIRWSCRATRRSLEAYHDGELPMEAQAAIQNHLRLCAGCSAERHGLRQVGTELRAAVIDHAPSDPDALGRQVLVRLAIGPEPSMGQRIRALFDDMHLVWPALGAVAATLACVAAALGLMRLTLREQPASMAALIGVLADPGSNRNPVSLDGRLLVPRSDGINPPVVDREDAVFALAAVVTREGRVSALELLLQDAGRSPVGQRAIVELLDAAAQTKFEPARAGDTPVAVNVVWLLAQTRVRGRIAPTPSSSIERPRTISRSGESSDAHPARVAAATTTA
jgi:putative zinc finger protein